MVTVPARLIGQPGIEVLHRTDALLLLRKTLGESRYEQSSYLSRHALSRVVSGRQVIYAEDGRTLTVEAGGPPALLRRGLYTVTDLVTGPEEPFEVWLLYFDSVDYALLVDEPAPHPRPRLQTLLRALAVHPELDSLRHAPRRRDALDFLEHHYDKPLTLEDYAYLTGSSVSTFQRQFRRRTGTSPRRWIVQRRMEKARELLATGHYQSRQLAAAVGYENVSHFIRQYRLTYGRTPGKVTE